MRVTLSSLLISVSLLTQAQFDGAGRYLCLATKTVHSEPTFGSQNLLEMGAGDYFTLTSTIVFEEVGAHDIKWHRTSSGGWVTDLSIRKSDSNFCDERRSKILGEGVTLSMATYGSITLLEFGEVEILKGLEKFRHTAENRWFREDGKLHLKFVDKVSDPSSEWSEIWTLDQSKDGQISAEVLYPYGTHMVQVSIENERLDLKYKSCIRHYVEEAINTWQEKGEFEKISDYQNRVNEASLNEQVAAFEAEAIELILGDLNNTFEDLLMLPGAVEVSRYDAENETFRVHFSSFGSIVLPVSINVARQFKMSFDPENFESAQFALIQGAPAIQEVQYLAPNGIVATYEMSNISSFVDSEFEYTFNDLGLELNESFEDSLLPAASLKVETIKSTNPPASKGYTEFNTNPKDVVVDRVAVVAAKGMDCSGIERPGQDLASYVEGSLLGYYEVVERRNLERVLDEQKLALSGIMFEKSTVEAGCNIGAQGIIFTEFGCISGEETIQVKLVDCQTSELYWSAIGHGSGILDVVKEIKTNLDEK